MRKYGKWLLVLGILAANPAWVSADGFLSGLRSPQAKAAEREQNQQKAEEVAAALKKARLNGYDLEVEVRGDIVKLEGKVRDVNHRGLASAVATQVNGIERVVNNLKYVPSGDIQQTAGRYTDNALQPATYNVVDGGSSEIQQVHFQKPGRRSEPKKQTVQARPQMQPQMMAPKVQSPPEQAQLTPRPPAIITSSKPAEKHAEPVAQPVPKPAPLMLPATHTPQPKPMEEPAAIPPAHEVKMALPTAPAGPSNQEVAQQIADNIGQVGVTGYNIEVRYEKGTATLLGDVATIQQRQAAEFAASQVEGVRGVQNQLNVSGPIAQTSFQQARPSGPVAPVSMTMAPYGAPAGAPMPIGGAGNYSNPQLPSHAWPAYAAYPNSAAIQYPTQHSASAFPYIGPFYPYPQVPLGWREVSLQWDDGFWQLDFEQKHDAWYWLWHPKNWH
ncbi:MAG: BON domain-containing protein [Planctomycetaceae bacterium]